MKKKLFTVLFISIAVVALACAFAACVSSDDIGDPDDLTYMKQGDEYVVTGIGGYDGSNLVIPAKHNGLPVTSIDDYAFFNCKTITAVTIPDTVTYIGDYAFYYCKYIKSVNIPKDVLYIGSYAFYKCTGLENVYYDAVNPRSTYSSSFEYIGEDVFNSTVTVGKDVIRIPSSIFYYANVTDVVFEVESSCTSIGSNAFYSCGSLRTVTIPHTVTFIDDTAFYSCYKLVEVCNLSSLDIVAGSTSNGYVGYYAARIYTDADEPSYVSTTDSGFVFYDDGDSSYLIDYSGKGLSLVLPTLENGRTYGIWRYAFYNRKEFEIVTIPECVTSIGTYAFYNCTSITSLTIGSGVTSIGTYAFYGCTSISEIYFNAESVDDFSSANYVFGNAGQYGDGVTVTVGAGVTSIPAYLFCPYSSNASYAPKITSVIFEDGSRCTSVGYHAFYCCTSITGVYISDIYTWSGIKFGNSYANPLYYSGDLYVDGVLTTSLPNDLTSIGTYAFSGWDVTDLTIPGSVTSMGGNAFSSCLSLETLTINEGVVTIGYSAFSGCSSLQTVTVGKSVTSMGNSAFSGCTSIKSVYAADLDSWCNISFDNSTSSPLNCGADLYLDDNLVTDLNFSDDVTSIGQYAFSGCTSLKSVTIPESVTSIGDYAFYNCTEITEINFNAVALNNLSSYNDVFYNAGLNASGIIVKIGTEVARIPSYLFDPHGNSSAPNITTVIFEDGCLCTSIGSYAFAYCGNLISVTIPSSVTTIDSQAFYNCTALEEIYFNAVSMEDLSYENGVFYKAGQSGTGITVMVGKYVTKIPAYLFYAYGSSTTPKITSLNFEEGSMCASIGSYAFRYCEYLTSVTIPACVTSIGNYAFSECTRITEIFFNAESMNDLSSTNYVFQDAGQSGSGITLTIGSGVTKIPAYLFDPYSSSSYSTRISTVIFEKDSQCSSIGSHAFGYCSYITAVYYSGTAEEWSAMSINSNGNSYLTNATRYYYSEEEPSEDGNYWHYVDGEIVVWKKES